MFLIGIDERQSTDTIVNTTRHLPIGSAIPRISAITNSGIMTDDGMYGFDADRNLTWRLISTPDGVCEETFWRDGVELRRIAFRIGGE